MKIKNRPRWSWGILYCLTVFLLYCIAIPTYLCLLWNNIKYSFEDTKREYMEEFGYIFLNLKKHYKEMKEETK